MNKKGFTIIELLVAIAIVAVIAGAGFLILGKSFRYNRIIWEQLETQNQGRKVLQEVVSNAREAEESEIGAYPIETAGEYELTFYADIDNDSLREKVRFWLDGTTFKKGVVKPSGEPLSYSGSEQTVELAHHVVNISQAKEIFSYYGQNYTGSESALAQPVDVTEVRLVRVYLELEKDPAESPVPLSLETVIYPRNLASIADLDGAGGDGEGDGDGGDDD